MPEGKHSEHPTYLEIPCRRARVVLEAAGVGLAAEGAVRMLWDEHGGTFVIRAAGLTEVEKTDPAQPGVSLEISLAPGDMAAADLKEFAGRMNLPLGGPTASGGEFREPVIMAAAHLPGQKLFAFSEEPHLTATRSGPKTLEIRILGDFKTKTLPSQEADLVIHLTSAAMARLVAYVLALLPEG